MPNFNQPQPLNEFEAEALLAAEAQASQPETAQLRTLRSLGKVELQGAEVQLSQAA